MQSKEFVNLIKKREVKISVIVPVYNSEKHLERCLESILFQTLLDIEVIIINDGSTDNSNKIIEKFLPDKRVIYIKQENKGKHFARNKGLSLAKGEYISFIDSNDYVDSDFFGKLYKIGNKNDADIVASSIVRKHDTYEKWRVNYTRNRLITNKDEMFSILKFPKQPYIWNKIYKKSFLDKIGFNFRENSYFGEIIPLTLALINCEKLCIAPDTNYYYLAKDRKITRCKRYEKYENIKKSIKFIIENDIKLSKNDYFINKLEIKLLFLPVLKIKENIFYKKEKFLLFNFIPVLYIKQKTMLDFKIFLKRLFSISNFDYHILIMFLFFKFKIKYKRNFEIKAVKNIGITEEKREVKIIASLTSSKEKIKTVSNTIKTILNQTIKADEVILYLSDNDFKGKETSLPSDLLTLRDFGLQIKWCKNLKAYKKLIPALKEYENDIIITFNDDVYYENDIIETLYKSYLEHPDEIQTNRIKRIEIERDKIKLLDSSYMYFNEKEYKKDSSLLNVLDSTLGVLYPPNCLSEKVFIESEFNHYNDEDVWFYYNAILKGTKIRLNKGYSCHLAKTKGMKNIKKDFDKLVEKHPEIIQILRK